MLFVLHEAQLVQDATPLKPRTCATIGGTDKSYYHGTWLHWQAVFSRDCVAMSEAERIGQRLRTLRVGRGLTQAQVGEGAGFTAKYVSEIERGARPDLPLSTLEAIVVQGLGGSVSELFGDSRRGKTKHALPQ